MKPRHRVRIAWVLLGLSIVGWPVSAMTFAKSEPPTVLGLSWIGITLIALDFLSTSDVRKTIEDEEGK